MGTLFTKIIQREIPAKIIYEDADCIAFHDVNPQAPTHFLVVPKQELARIGQATPAQEPLLGHLLFVAKTVAKEQGLGESGFRIVINNGSDGGETVPHLHVHVLGGRPMVWPPG